MRDPFAEQEFLRQVLDGWAAQMRARNFGENTITGALQQMRRIAESIGAPPWRWSVEDVDAYFSDLRLAGRARSTITRYQSIVATFLEYMIDPAYVWNEQCWERFGTHTVQLLTKNRARHLQDEIADPAKRALTRAELQAFFDAADQRVATIKRLRRKGALVAYRNAVMFRVQFAFGLRRREVAYLSLDSFLSSPEAPEHGARGLLEVKYAKALPGGVPRDRTVVTVPETAWVLSDLDAWEVQRARMRFAPDTRCLWPGERGPQISLSSINSAFAQIRDLAGLDPILDPHSLRRSYVTLLAESGYDLLFTQHQVGHDHPGTTADYTFITEEFRRITVAHHLEGVAAAALADGVSDARR